MMNFVRAHGVCGWLLVALLMTNMTTTASAQVFTDPADWKESDVPPPPAYDMSKLLTFEVTRSSPLVYGVDPASFSISKTDGIVRYVVVATSRTSAGGRSRARSTMPRGSRTGVRNGKRRE